MAGRAYSLPDESRRALEQEELDETYGVNVQFEDSDEEAAAEGNRDEVRQQYLAHLHSAALILGLHRFAISQFQFTISTILGHLEQDRPFC